jgi:hypothetical protein
MENISRTSAMPQICDCRYGGNNLTNFRGIKSAIFAHMRVRSTSQGQKRLSLKVGGSPNHIADIIVCFQDGEPLAIYLRYLLHSQ